MTQGAVINGKRKGNGRFSPKKESVFTASIDLTSFTQSDEVVVVAAARVDSSWTKRVKGTRPNKPPQSHIVNVRNNPSWKFQTNGKIIEGRLYWFSIPQTILIV
jgi:hypothetical protein